ncbi:hypothetical protein [Novosphingobium gossypii]|uniref:hypothetical protein n=1 Tax=Novosphingobium gossypii TaxID=1604774 RepID=UPI003D19E445
MTRQDRHWRGLGAVLLVGAPCAELLIPGDASGLRGMLTLLLLATSLAGIVFLLRGKKVMWAWRIESGRHRKLPELIRSRRQQRAAKRRP